MMKNTISGSKELSKPDPRIWLLAGNQPSYQKQSILSGGDQARPQWVEEAVGLLTVQ